MIPPSQRKGTALHKAVARWRALRISRIRHSPPKFAAWGKGAIALLCFLVLIRIGQAGAAAPVSFYLLVFVDACLFLKMLHLVAAHFRERTEQISATRRRSAIKAARRERDRQMRIEKGIRKASLRSAELRLVEERARRRDAMAQVTMSELIERAESDRRQSEAAYYLNNMPMANFQEAVRSIFSLSGGKIECVQDESGSDFVVSGGAENTNKVVRIRPDSGPVGVVEIRELDAWRLSARASTAFMISRTGFEPACISVAEGLPIILVEPHLLAVWKGEMEIVSDDEADLDTASIEFDGI